MFLAVIFSSTEAKLAFAISICSVILDVSYLSLASFALFIIPLFPDIDCILIPARINNIIIVITSTISVIPLFFL